MVDRRCTNCRFWCYDTSDCRRKPPRVTRGVSRWPKTRAEDWCGEFKPFDD